MNQPVQLSINIRTIPDLVRALRKAETHVHLEGTNEPEFAFERARRNNVRMPYATPEALRHAYNFGCLADFLALYYQNCSALVKPDDFYDLTMAYLIRAAADNVVHVEPFFDPQSHTGEGRNIPIEDVIIPIHQALQDGRTRFGITSRLIPNFLRDLPPEDAMSTYKSLKPFGDKVFGFGLDSYERPFPPRLFADVFAALRADGYAAFAHAGEEGPWEYVEEAVDILQVMGIDHGNACLDNLALVRRLVQKRLRLTVCPFSNLRLKVIQSLSDHKIRLMLQLGLLASLHSDDPAYFPGPNGLSGYINDNYIGTAEATEMTAAEVVKLANNSLETSFMEDDTLKREHIAFNDNLLLQYLAAKA